MLGASWITLDKPLATALLAVLLLFAVGVVYKRGPDPFPLLTDGVNWCVDTDADNIACETGEPNLTVNAPTNAGGDQTVQGNLTVVGGLVTATGEAERTLVWWSISTGDAWTVANCVSAFDAQPDGLCTTFAIELPANATFTKLCGSNPFGGALFNGSDSVNMRLRNTASTTTYANLLMDSAAGFHTFPNYACVNVLDSTYPSDEDIVLEVQAITDTPGSTAGSDFFFELRGHY